MYCNKYCMFIVAGLHQNIDGMIRSKCTSNYIGAVLQENKFTHKCQLV